MGPNALKFFHSLARKNLTKNRGSGITEIANRMGVESEASSMIQTIVNSGLPLEQFDQFIRSEADVLKFLNLIKASSQPRVISATSPEGKAITEKLFGKKGEVVDMTGKKMDTSQGIMGGKSIKELMESGQVQKGTDDIKISEKITDREMFKGANERFNETENFVTNTITKIKSMEPITAMKEANLIIGRKGKYKNLTSEESKKILTDTEDHIFERDIPIDPEDMARGGRAGFYTGGITDVEPSLDDIGHGADALNARTRLLSPGAQATTSTGLNYLLADDNDNMRIPFSGGGMGRRTFLKLLASIGGGVAAAKSGILNLGGKGATKQVAKEVATGQGTVPPYFFKLVEKIKMLGDNTLATKDKTIAKKYKDYTMEEDFAGNIEIIKKGANPNEEVYIKYTADDVELPNKKGFTKAEEYEEFTARPDADGKMKNIEQGVPDEVVMEVEAGSGNVSEAMLKTLRETKKADGGRIGFVAGGLSKLGINSTSRRFLEKVFGKEKFATMIENDPRMHRGMLEVVEMFRNKDKEGLKKYMQKFLPDMDDATVEDFIVGGKGSEGIEGQLIRLGSGREYKNLINMKKEADQIRKLDDFDIDGVSKNAEGGRIGFSGGGIFRAIIAKSAASKGLSVRDFIKATNYKGLSPEVKMYISAEEFAALKSGQKDLYDNFIDMAKTRKNFQEQIEGGKGTPAKPLFDNLEQTMDEKSFVPKTVTSDDIAQMELMVKNRFNKDRKDNAQGGLQNMLGE